MQNVVKMDLYAEFDAASLTTSYKLMNGVGLDGPAILIRLINNSDVDVDVSYDGTTRHDFVPSKQLMQLDFQANSAPNNSVAMLKQGTKIYLKGAKGTGKLYLAVYYLKA